VTRIIEHRQHADASEKVFELRVFQLHVGDVRACLVPSHLVISHNMMDETSKPVAQAYLDALALCEREGVTTLWVHDSLSLFPAHDRPERELS
jgi:hypothetical protein